MPQWHSLADFVCWCAWQLMWLLASQRRVDVGYPVRGKQSEDAGTGGGGTDGCVWFTQWKQSGGHGAGHIQELQQSGEGIYAKIESTSGAWLTLLTHYSHRIVKVEVTLPSMTMDLDSCYVATLWTINNTSTPADANTWQITTCPDP